MHLIVEHKKDFIIWEKQYHGKLFYAPFLNCQLNYFSCFHETLEFLIQLHKVNVYMPTAKTVLYARIGEDSKYKNYFHKYISALNGTHIASSVPIAMASLYQNRKRY